MKIIAHLKRFALTYVPGMRTLRKKLSAFRTMKSNLRALSTKIKHLEILLTNIGINNTALYYEVLHKRFDLQSPFLKFSKSQLDQDLFVMYALQGKENGFFVEFGATNGMLLSNSYLLETQFNWNGILAEPGKSWHEDLHKNRTCKIDRRCVYSSSGKTITFADSIEPELSTIKSFVDCDGHAETRKKSKHYAVETISLNNLLETHEAPKKIDYLSIDTEGSEFEILSAFDFSRYDILIITVEHNYTENREKIHNLLSHNGFKRIYKKYSQFDDWYVQESALGKEIFCE